MTDSVNKNSDDDIECACSQCERYRKIKKALAFEDVEELKQIVNELLDSVMFLEEDLDYKNCILDGSWPSAVEQLKKALKKAEKIAKERNYENK